MLHTNRLASNYSKALPRKEAGLKRACYRHRDETSFSGFVWTLLIGMYAHRIPFRAFYCGKCLIELKYFKEHLSIPFTES